MQRLLLLLVLLVAGCAPEIGDACEISTDCSQGAERLCDVAQKGGYCTVFDCEAGKCPEEATCVVFDNACGNASGTSASQRSFCMRTCEDDSDCRSGEGYRCLEPVRLGAQSVEGPRKVCIFVPQGAVVPTAAEAMAAEQAKAEAGVCQAQTPSDDGAAGAGSD
jgi:hypothetical protein